MKTKSIYRILVAASLFLAANAFAQTTTECDGSKAQTHLQKKDQLKDATGDKLKDQTKDQTKDRKKDGTCITDAATTESTQVKTKVEPVGQNQSKFKASLSEEQVALLQNKTMTKAEKQAAFMNSLSAEQVNMLKTNHRQQGSINESTAARTKDQIKQQQKNQTQDCENIAASGQQKRLQQAQQVVGSGNGGSGHKGRK